MGKNKEQGFTFKNLILSVKIPKLQLFLGLVGSIVTTMIGLTLPLLTRNLIDNYSFSSPEAAPLLVLIGIVFIVQAISSGFSLYLLSAVGQKVVANLREKMWLKIIRLPVRYFDQTSSGETVSRIINDTNIIRGLISVHFPTFIVGIVSILGTVTILLILDWKLTLILLIAIPFTLAIVIPLGKKMSKISQELLDEMASFMGKIQQTISEIRLVKSSTAEKDEEKKGLLGIHNILQYGLKDAKIVALVSPIMQFLMLFVVMVVISYGSMQVKNEVMTMGTLVAFLLYVYQILTPVTDSAKFFTELQRSQGATKRIIAILIQLSEDHQKGFIQDVFNQPIHFNNVSFAYNDNQNILKNISFSVQPGKMIAIVGPSGGGKTTLFELMQLFYQPTDGSIKVGNKHINELSLHSWRGQIGYVTQENAMMAGTIRENLCYGLDSSVKENHIRLLEVIRLAHADEFIKSFPKGLDTDVGERGVKLSGGQRQRIAIARAFLRDPKILMLDEATSNLDSHSEKKIHQALEHLMKNRTTFVIAHRLSTIVNADQIIFIDKGKITGMGTHEQLYKTHKLYRRFTEQQFNMQLD